MEIKYILLIPLVAGYLLDLFIGDPQKMPHPVRFFGTLIGIAEKMLNKGPYRLWKGGLMVVVLCAATYIFFAAAMHMLLKTSLPIYLIFCSIFVCYGLANRSLITEGKKVFDVLHAEGLEAGRARLSWIVGRDTSALSHQQIRKAVFETMSENLSDGVVAPLFYYLIAGLPGMMTYKMINTMDSMVGYRNEKYEWFGKCAARLDDIANFIPSRLTALLMVIVTLSHSGLKFIFRYGHLHKSPNSGYPEAALAGIINVRFGGPNTYNGVLVDKPCIGINDRDIAHEEFSATSRINQLTCLVMVLLISFLYLFDFKGIFI